MGKNKKGKYRKYHKDDWDDDWDDDDDDWDDDDDDWDDDDDDWDDDDDDWDDDDDDWDDDDDDWDDDDDDCDDDDDWDDDEEYEDWKDDGYYPSFDPQLLGEYGEQLTEEMLQILRSLQYDGKILRNVYVPKSNGRTTEIDLLFITQKGVFVIESKNYSGWIFGNEKDKQWIAMFPRGEVRNFYNPVMQNSNHIKWLKRYLGFQLPCYSLVVFSERCELKIIKVSAPGVGVVKRNGLIPLMIECWDKFRDCFSNKMIEEVYSKLLPCINVDEETKQKHNDTCF